MSLARSSRFRRLAIFALLWTLATIGGTVIMFNALTAVPSDEQLAEVPRIVETQPVPTTPPQLPTATPIIAEDATMPFDLGVFVRETQPNVDDSVMDGYLDAASRQLDLNWIRLEMRWEFVEPEPGNYVWETWDTVFRLAVGYDLNVVLTITGSPLWARGDGTTPYLNDAPSNYALYANFVTTVLRRYPNQIHAVEVWQGGNFVNQWSSGPDPTAYVELISQTASLVREVAPNILIISGGLEPTSGGQNIAIDDFIYLDGLIEAGILNHVDCIGVHHSGFNLPPDVPWDAVPPDDSAVFRGPFDNPHHSWSFFTTLTTYARKIAAAGSEVPLCVTEFGWAVTTDLAEQSPELRFATDNTLAEQANWLADAIQLMRSWGFVRLAMINNLNVGAETGFDPQIAETAYSLIRPEYAISPAWEAISDLQSLLSQQQNIPN